MAPLSDKLYWTVVAFLAAIGAAVAAVLLWPRPQPVIEVAKPAIVQSDESLILERTDTQPSVKPPHVVPKGSTVERVVQVKVKPKVVIADGIKDAPSLSPDAKPANNPITVDLSLVRLKDDTKRVIASSPDGEIVGGLDIPVETLAYKPRVWAAGISINPVHQTPGIWVERDVMRLRVGVEANQVQVKSGGRDGEIRVRLGWVW